MCGISGFISNKKEEELINDLTQTLVHRGPDSQGWTIIESRGKYIHLGCCRLAIRGGVGADMPIKDSEGNVLVYNGEIFDQRSLNSKCKQKIDFKKEGDAKLLFQYLKEGNDPSSINGMFAFAYWDSKTETLKLARDKLGIKPLVITDTANSDLVFSSELKSLLSFPLVQRRISTETVHSILALGGPAPDLEIIDNVRPVKPGSSVTWKEGKVSNASFHTRFQHINRLSPIEISEFIELLSLVVEDHLMADVPVEVLLSGGLDSSLLSLIIKRYLDKEVTNHTLSFEESSFDELTAAERFSNVLNNNLTSYKFTESEMEENVEEALSQMNYPVLDPSFVPTYYLSKKYRRILKQSFQVMVQTSCLEDTNGIELIRYPKNPKLFVPFFPN